MAARNKYSMYAITAVFMVVAVILSGLYGCKKEQPESGEPAPPVNETSASQPPNPSGDALVDPLRNAAELFGQPRESLQKIIDGQNTWMVVFEQWWGKIAPDFTLTDIDGNAHKLSSDRGKNVVVVFFATWCGPKKEVPHLKELREMMPAKDLAILAISNEAPALLKEFVANQGINYTVLSNSGSLPTPYSEVKYSPSTFFIDRNGRFKLAATGMISAEDAKAILEAK